MIEQIKRAQLTNINRVQGTAAKVETDKSAKSAQILSDRVEITKAQQPSVVYAKPEPQKTNATDLNAVIEQVQRATENMRALVESLITKQVQIGNYVLKGTLVVDADTIEQAKMAVSQDGEFSVKVVSDRIVQFAVAISGGDRSKVQELKSAIDKGFAAAKESFGGELPDISYQTYDEIMKKLDAWESEET